MEKKKIIIINNLGIDPSSGSQSRETSLKCTLKDTLPAKSSHYCGILARKTVSGIKILDW